MVEHLSCSYVSITIDVLRICYTHSYITNSQEIAGLLLGRVYNLIDKTFEVEIFSTLPSKRTCKESDRVEIEEIEMSAALTQAEEITKITNIETNVVGWYHSHPRITVFPSNVDGRTQFNQQQGPFIGLIFSVFQFDKKTEIGKLEMVAFESYQDPLTKDIKTRTIPIRIVPTYSILKDSILKKYDYFHNLSKLQNDLLAEEDEGFEDANTLVSEMSLGRISNASTYTINYAKILEHISLPFKYSIDCLKDNLEQKYNYVKEENKVLQQYIVKIKEGIKNTEDKTEKIVKGVGVYIDSQHSGSPKKVSCKENEFL